MVVHYAEMHRLKLCKVACANRVRVSTRHQGKVLGYINAQS